MEVYILFRQGKYDESFSKHVESVFEDQEQAIRKLNELDTPDSLNYYFVEPSEFLKRD